MAAKKKFDYRSALTDLKQQIAHNKGPATSRPLEAELHEDALAGVPLIINKRPIKLDGKMYPVGSEVVLDPGSNLLRTNYVTTKRRWDAGEQYYGAYKFHRDVVQPVEIQANQARQKLTKAQAKHIAALAQVKEAEDDIATAKSQLANREKELSDVLEGHEV